MCLAGLLLLAGASFAFGVEGSGALILGREVPILQLPAASAPVIRTARAGETFEVIGRKTGKGQPLYILDEKGNLWVKVRVSEDTSGFLRTDQVSVAREDFRSPRGNPLLIVNLRPTADGGVTRELWLVQEGWHRTRRLGPIDGRPVWASHGEWFLCQMDSERPVKDPNMERTIERIERFSADGRSRLPLAAGTYPILSEARGEVYFYRDVDEQGDLVPPGLFAVNVDGTNLHPVFLLPEQYRFWKEDGDFFIEAPSPVLHTLTNHIAFYAYDTRGSKARFTVTLDGHLVELRTD